MAKQLSNHRKEWASADIKQLKSLARANTPASVIAGKMKRTVAAITQRASTEGVSLRVKNAATKRR